MPATDDRWDVVVVGLRDPSQANTAMVVAELAHYASMPTDEIGRALADDAELEVLSKLDRAEAERAAHELYELGAVVDLRLTPSHSGVFPVFKPDADRQVGVAVGGIIDDSATPPMMGEVIGNLPEVEPDPESGRFPAATPRARQRRRNPSPPPSPPPTPAPAPDPLDLLPMGDSGVHAVLEDLGGPPGIGSELPSGPPPSAAPTLSGPEPESHHDLLPDHIASKGRRGPGGMGGGSPRQARSPTPRPASKPSRPEAASRPRKPSPSPKAGGGGGLLSPEPPPAKREPIPTPGASASLELDFEAVGLKKPPKKGGVPKQDPMAAPNTAAPAGEGLPRRTRAGNMGGSGASAAGKEEREESIIDLLRSDLVALSLLIVSAALIASMVTALQLQRGEVRDMIPPLEEELAESLNDPVGVEQGELRSPDEVETEITELLGDLETSFFLWWIIGGVSTGLAIARFLRR